MPFCYIYFCFFFSSAVCSTSTADIVIALDASTSVTEENFRTLLSFVQDFVRPAEIDNGNVRIGMLSFSTDVHIQFHMYQHPTKEGVLKAIGNVPYSWGSTNTADALKTVRTTMFLYQHGDRPDVRNILLLVTDGLSNINSRMTIPEANSLRDHGIIVFAVGIGLSNTRELDGIANKPLDKYRFNVANFSALQDLDRRIFSSICVG